MMSEDEEDPREGQICMQQKRSDVLRWQMRRNKN